MSVECPFCRHTLEVILEDVSAAPAEASRPEPASDPVKELRSLLNEIVDDEVDDSRSREFLQNMRARLSRFGDRTLVSERQFQYLKSLSERQKPSEPPFNK